MSSQDQGIRILDCHMGVCCHADCLWHTFLAFRSELLCAPSGVVHICSLCRAMKARRFVMLRHIHQQSRSYPCNTDGCCPGRARRPVRRVRQAAGVHRADQPALQADGDDAGAARNHAPVPGPARAVAAAAGLHRPQLARRRLVQQLRPGEAQPACSAHPALEKVHDLHFPV